MEGEQSKSEKGEGGGDMDDVIEVGHAQTAVAGAGDGGAGGTAAAAVTSSTWLCMKEAYVYQQKMMHATCTVTKFNMQHHVPVNCHIKRMHEMHPGTLTHLLTSLLYLMHVTSVFVLVFLCRYSLHSALWVKTKSEDGVVLLQRW